MSAVLPRPCPALTDPPPTTRRHGRAQAVPRLLVAIAGLGATMLVAAAPGQAACHATKPSVCLRAGELDPTFGVNQYAAYYDFGDGLSTGAMDMAVLPNGRIVMGGSTTIDGGVDHDPTVARFLASGLPDVGFGSGGVLRFPLGPGNAIIQSVALQSDGMLVVAGGYDPSPSRVPGYTTGYAPTTSFLARITTGGALDTNFGSGGLVLTTDPDRRGYDRVLLDTDERIVAVGTGASGALLVERFDANGALDPTFGVGGTASTTGIPGPGGLRWAVYYRRAAALQADGKIVIAGTVFGVGPYINCGLARFDTDGNLDASFSGGQVLSPQAAGEVCHFDGVAIQADGKILASGSFYGAPGKQKFHLRRFASDGSVDTTFGKHGRWLTRVTKYPVTVTSHTVAVQSDGMIVQGGSAGGGQFVLSRHGGNGRPDRHFGRTGKGGVVETGIPGSATAVFDGVQALAILPNGRILAGGNPGFTSTFALARYLDRPCVFDPLTNSLTCP